MAEVRWTLQATVEADPDTVFAWLTDYRADDHGRPAFLRGAGRDPGKGVGSHRTVARAADGTVAITDRWGRRRFRSRVTIHPVRRELEIDGDYGYRAVWRALPAGSGTRVEVEGVMEARGVGALFLRLMGRKFVKGMAADLNGHMEDLRQDLGVGGQAPPAG